MFFRKREIVFSTAWNICTLLLFPSRVFLWSMSASWKINLNMQSGYKTLNMYLTIKIKYDMFIKPWLKICLAWWYCKRNSWHQNILIRYQSRISTNITARWIYYCIKWQYFSINRVWWKCYLFSVFWFFLCVQSSRKYKLLPIFQWNEVWHQETSDHQLITLPYHNDV